MREVIAIELPLYFVADDLANIACNRPYWWTSNSCSTRIWWICNPNVKGLVCIAALHLWSTTVPPFPKEFNGKPLLIFDNGGFAHSIP